MDAFELMRTRRSTRKYKDAPLQAELIKKVVEAGRYAPSGSNSQSTHFIVITDRAALDTLSKLVMEQFALWETKPGMYPAMARAVTASKRENYTFHYNAPVLAVLANKKDYTNNLADCALAAENMMLMANALDLGSCYINQLKWLNENDVINEYLMSLGMKPDERVFVSVALGYADTEDGLPVREPLARKGNPVTMI
ncbi:MAG: nitroreductase [Clostridia bacterium]|nr:nitroreductase [Clostridia bacterium]